MKLFIVTTTYNRSEEMKRLFVSLQMQTCTDFEWLIIDDGSTDGTSDLVNQFIEKSKFPITYIFKENGGKHTAYNRAITHMGTGGFHVIVDSDDWLAESAVATFLRDISLLLATDYIGVVYPKTSLKNKYTWLPRDVKTVNIPEIKFLYGLNIETCIVISNSATDNFQFPSFNNEKFLSEETFYYYLVAKGSFLPRSAEVYYFEYLEDGLTNNIFMLWKKNTKGTLYSLEQRKNYIKNDLRGRRQLIELAKVKLNINALLFLNKDFKKYTLLDYLMLPITLIFCRIRFK
ncbi:glycosyltransferase family 2 protein [Streptococcus suis]|nr:Glycosyltransferase [Streptococcus suis]